MVKTMKEKKEVRGMASLLCKCPQSRTRCPIVSLGSQSEEGPGSECLLFFRGSLGFSVGNGYGTLVKSTASLHTFLERN